MTVVRTGCASWSIPRAAAADFPAEGSHLQRYAAVFNAVEINSSFYRPHQPRTYARWAADVPDDFRFSVKAPRRVTHERRLDDCAEPMAQFAGGTAALGAKLGCVLVQLPPSLDFDAATARAFFKLARRHFDCMIACEARHASWFSDAATRLLEKAGVTRVIADPAKGQPGEHVPTTPGAYVRLHGSPRVYYSSYEDEALDRYAALLARADGESWCVFDNTASGASVPNAVALLRRLGPG
ncbi:DUF72 domain-containing protein [Pseudoduganella namucuonensis]|uniref:Uncharacterized conserved protein YecE, DUF72 family n=1 Tax=Pseudoduganella namucuonensis TaxID=1035707 RepID=A0A1I7K5U4_9BURK|nr:DUF72 domain-containing protein [Pseudoduganella namucuonensis]SFU92784.1 Uncharacterized conserved protein YecE, DUF72 family [Pseudoduganella namucuonensis]